MFKLFSRDKSMDFWSTTSVGIGAMVGGGIFAVLGLAVSLAGGGTPVTFIIAGIIALITSYSYARLTITYPGMGGTVNFINQAFGRGLVTGSLNIMLYFNYVVMLSLYSYAFGSYGAQLIGGGVFTKHLLLSGIIIIFTAFNIMGTEIMGKIEKWVVGFKLAILLLFIVAGIWTVNTGNLQISNWSPPIGLMAGGLLIFVAYEGFELIANAAGDVKNPEKVLPRAYFSAIVFVIILYFLISVVAAGNLPAAKIVEAKDYALAVAARPFFGQLGFLLITVAALLSTSSAINATLYGSSKISYILAREDELPDFFENKIWNKPLEGLFITSGLTLLMANIFDLESISLIGSAGFLIIFLTVNLANFKLREETASRAWLPVIGIAANCLQ